MSQSLPHVPGATVLRAADGVLRRSAGAETVILDLDSEQFYGLDGVGARVFELLEEPRTLDSVVDSIHAEYAVERDVLAADLQALVGELLQRDLLVVAG